MAAGPHGLLDIVRTLKCETWGSKTAAAYKASVRGIAVAAAYKASDRGIAVAAAYEASDCGIAVAAAYEASDCGIAVRAAWAAAYEASRPAAAGRAERFQQVKLRTSFPGPSANGICLICLITLRGANKTGNCGCCTGCCREVMRSGTQVP